MKNNDEEKVKVNKVTIRVDYSTGGHHQIETFTPENVSLDLCMALQKWRDEYLYSASFLKQYFEAEDEFIERLTNPP